MFFISASDCHESDLDRLWGSWRKFGAVFGEYGEHEWCDEPGDDDDDDEWGRKNA